jgi:glycosyltransferase involved in cell wall biosynthesis
VESSTRGAGDADRLSVVLATYQGEEFLAAQLASLVSQARLPDEVVIVDDCSSDATPALLSEFAQRAPFPVDLVLRREHLGTWATFEEGLRRATGDILVICDQDDVWREHKLALLADRMAVQPDALMAFSDARLIDSAGELIGRSRWRVAGFSPRTMRAMSRDPFGPLISHQAVSGCTMAIRAGLLPALLPFPAEVHPALPTMMYDRWISLMAAAAAPAITVPEPLVDYRIHPGQQIGIPALRIRRIVPRAALSGAQFLRSRFEVAQRMEYHLAHLEQIDKRLAAAGLDTPRSRDALSAAEEHLRFRSSLAPHRRSRLGPVLGELRDADGYRRFSLGVSSAVADLAR